jgi:hypothetical protein
MRILSLTFSLSPLQVSAIRHKKVSFGEVSGEFEENLDSHY